MITLYPAELHIHSALSPCAGDEMDPITIMLTAIKLGLKIIAITDHNSTANLPAFIHQAPDELLVLPGIEAQSKEEVHLICLFPDLERAMAFGEAIYERLPPVENNPAFFGEQTIFDLDGKKMGQEERLLLNSVDLSLEDLIKQMKELDGLSYPAHIDRPSFSLLSQLGFFPSGLHAKIFELSLRANLRDYQQNYPDFTIIRSSDVHYLSDLQPGKTGFFLKRPCWEELLLAFSGVDGRRVVAY